MRRYFYQTTTLLSWCLSYFLINTSNTGTDYWPPSSSVLLAAASTSKETNYIKRNTLHQTQVNYIKHKQTTSNTNKLHQTQANYIKHKQTTSNTNKLHQTQANYIKHKKLLQTQTNYIKNTNYTKHKQTKFKQTTSKQTNYIQTNSIKRNENRSNTNKQPIPHHTLRSTSYTNHLHQTITISLTNKQPTLHQNKLHHTQRHDIKHKLSNVNKHLKLHTTASITNKWHQTQTNYIKLHKPLTSSINLIGCWSWTERKQSQSEKIFEHWVFLCM